METMQRSNEPSDLISQAIREFANAWREITEENLLIGYRARQHMEGKHDAGNARSLCLYCQEDHSDD